jgi:hypothetical protein
MADNRHARAHRRHSRALPRHAAAFVGTKARAPLATRSHRSVPATRPDRVQQRSPEWPSRTHHLPRYLRDGLPRNLGGSPTGGRRHRRPHLGHRRPSARFGRARLGCRSRRSHHLATFRRARGLLQLPDREVHPSRTHPRLAPNMVGPSQSTATPRPDPTNSNAPNTPAVIRWRRCTNSRGARSASACLEAATHKRPSKRLLSPGLGIGQDGIWPAMQIYDLIEPLQLGNTDQRAARAAIGRQPDRRRRRSGLGLPA